MKRSLATLAFLIGTVLAGSSFCHVSAQTPNHTVSAALLEDESGHPVELSGVIVDVLFRQYAVFKDHTGIILIQMDASVLDTSLQRGDLVEVTGKIHNDGTLRNIVRGAQVKIVSRARQPEKSTRHANIEAILNVASDGDVVSGIGTLKKVDGRMALISDKSGDLTVDLGERYGARLFREGASVGFVGTRETHLDKKKYLRVISLAELDSPLLGTPEEKAEDMKEVVAGGKQGEKVRVEGRVAEFIGAENLYFLFDGVNVIVLRPNEASKEITLSAGEVIEVSGMLGTETINDKEYMVLTEAVISRK